MKETGGGRKGETEEELGETTNRICKKRERGEKRARERREIERLRERERERERN